MADSVVEIHWNDAADKELEKQQKKVFDEKAPEKGCDVVRLTVGEIESILFIVYNITLDGSKLRKTDYVGALEKEMRTSISKNNSFLHLQK